MKDLYIANISVLILRKLGGTLARIYTLLLLVMIVWGFNLSALVVLVHAVEPMTLTSLRIFTAGIAVLFMSKLIGIFRLPTKTEWKTIVIISMFNVAIHHTLLAIGLTKTSGANASVILGSLPLMTMILTAIFLKQILPRIRILGFVFGFIGIMLTSIAGSDGIGAISYGDLLIFLSLLSQAYSFILISKLNPTFDPRLLTGYMLIVGSFFIFIVSLITEKNVGQLVTLLSLKLGAVFLFSSVVATAFGHMVYNYATRKVGPAETAIFTNLNTLFALFGAAIFLREAILATHYIGLILIVIGVFFGTGAYEYIVLKRREVN